MRLIGQQKHDDIPTSAGNPLSGLANLFDVSIVLIVALLFAIFSSLDMTEMFDPDSTVTYIKKTENGEMQIIQKDKKEIKVQKVTNKELSGKGIRLGTAYELEDGRVVYIPED